MVNGQDEATFSTSTLTVSGSPYAITAVYDGDSDDQGSTSNAVSQTITPAPLSITANSASKTYGQSATFSSTAFTETGLVTANGDSITGVTETSAARLVGDGGHRSHRSHAPRARDSATTRSPTSTAHSRSTRRP